MLNTQGQLNFPGVDASSGSVYEVEQSTTSLGRDVICPGLESYSSPISSNGTARAAFEILVSDLKKDLTLFVHFCGLTASGPTYRLISTSK